MQPGSPAYDRQLMAWSADMDRIAARVRQPVRTCAGCRRFQPGAINPTAGMGRCGAGRGHVYPNAPTYCRQHEAIA